MLGWGSPGQAGANMGRCPGSTRGFGWLGALVPSDKGPSAPTASSADPNHAMCGLIKTRGPSGRGGAAHDRRAFGWLGAPVPGGTDPPALSKPHAVF